MQRAARRPGCWRHLWPEPRQVAPRHWKEPRRCPAVMAAVRCWAWPPLRQRRHWHSMRPSRCHPLTRHHHVNVHQTLHAPATRHPPALRLPKQPPQQAWDALVAAHVRLVHCRGPTRHLPGAPASTCIHRPLGHHHHAARWTWPLLTPRRWVRQGGHRSNPMHDDPDRRPCLLQCARASATDHHAARRRVSHSQPASCLPTCAWCAGALREGSQHAVVGGTRPAKGRTARGAVVHRQRYRYRLAPHTPHTRQEGRRPPPPCSVH